MTRFSTRRASGRAIGARIPTVRLSVPQRILIGAALYRAGDWNGALQALRRAIHSKGYNNEPRTRYFLAMACWRLGKKDEANRWFDGTAPEPTSESLAAEPVSWFRQEAAAVLGRSRQSSSPVAGW